MTIKDDPEIQDALVECIKSTKFTAKFLFPERFYAPFNQLHDQIFDLIDSGAPRIAIAAPRGIGKTSIVALALAGKNILFQERNFIPYVNMSHDAAVLQTENLKHELMSNNIVKQLFGPLKLKTDTGMEESFSKKAWVSSGGTLVFPRGSGQQVRGLLYHNSRPDLIIVDDLEDPETLENEDMRRKRKEWFNADLLKSTSRLKKDWQIVYIDTLKHEDSLLQSLLDSPDWESVRLELFDDDYKSNVPDFISDEEIEREVKYHRAEGILDVLFREFRNLPISKEDASFKPEFFKHYEETDADFMKVVKHLENVVIVDPAKTAKMQSADSAIVGIGVDLRGPGLYVRDIVHGKFYPDELYDAMFDMCARMKSRVLAVETTGLEEFVKQPIKNEVVKRGLVLELLWLKARGGPVESGRGKIKRIAALVPFYRMGYIKHNKAVCAPLESQLMSYPRSKMWDVMDAVAYIVEVLEMGGRYFDPESELDEKVDDLDDIEYDEPLMNWRTI